MRVFLENIDKDLMKKYMQEVMMVMDKPTVKYINNMYKDILIQSDVDKEAKILLQYLFAAIYNEDISYNIFHITEEGSEIIFDGKWNDTEGINFVYLEKIKELWSLYSKNGLRIKDKRLRELYNIRVYYNVKNKISYKDINNIYDEVNRILDSKDIEFINLLMNRDASRSDTVTWACEEFLNMNETDPKMFSSDRVIIYSALLNYDSINDPLLLSKIVELSNIENKIFLSGNWKIYSSIFRKILDKFDKRLLHY